MELMNTKRTCVHVSFNSWRSLISLWLSPMDLKCYWKEKTYYSAHTHRSDTRIIDGLTIHVPTLSSPYEAGAVLAQDTTGIKYQFQPLWWIASKVHNICSLLRRCLNCEVWKVIIPRSLNWRVRKWVSFFLKRSFTLTPLWAESSLQFINAVLGQAA